MAVIREKTVVMYVIETENGHVFTYHKQQEAVEGALEMLWLESVPHVSTIDWLKEPGVKSLIKRLYELETDEGKGIDSEAWEAANETVSELRGKLTAAESYIEELEDEIKVLGEGE